MMSTPTSDRSSSSGNAGERVLSVGIVGYGKLGQYLAHEIVRHGAGACGLRLGFVWNRTAATVENDPVAQPYLLRELADFASVQVDLIIEVAHPSITIEFGERFIRHCDLVIGSPTVFADATIEATIRRAAREARHTCYVPSGALWGAVDLQKMADANTLGAVTITMKKEPVSLKLNGSVAAVNAAYIASDNTDEVVLYDGPVRDLCPMAPNNVNTMACAALAAHSLGFDRVRARLCADKKLTAHVIEIDIRGVGTRSSRGMPSIKLR